MRNRLEKHLSENFPFLKKASLVVACSGGLDSVVLTYLLHNLDYDISLAHCNFSLREDESDADEKFVIKLAKKLKVPVFTETFDTKLYAEDTKVSTQMAARSLRYQWFDELLKITGKDFILTAHHMDDDLETFLINCSRGTGLKGLTGIPERNDRIIRPLLNFSRQEIADYAVQKDIKWREDSSNAGTQYLRNALRHRVIPEWKKTNVALLQNFKTTQKHLQGSEALIDDYIALIFSYVSEQTEDGYRFSVEKLKKLPNVRVVLYELLQVFGFSEWEDIYHLLDAQSGKQVFSEDYVLLKDRDYLILASKDFANTATDSDDYITIPKGTTKLASPIALTFESVDEVQAINPETIYVDADVLKYPLKIRKWEEGDVFYPFGMTGKKKLSKFFKDEKLSLLNKQKTRLLLSDEKIIWVVGMRADDRFKVTPKTKNILKIQLQK
tara:strand:- start:78341 stop:79663 length:1323 start_codon:yes stop_codon:yes gene_type:complete